MFQILGCIHELLQRHGCCFMVGSRISSLPRRSWMTIYIYILQLINIFDIMFIMVEFNY